MTGGDEPGRFHQKSVYCLPLSATISHLHAPDVCERCVTTAQRRSRHHKHVPPRHQMKEFLLQLRVTADDSKLRSSVLCFLPAAEISSLVCKQHVKQNKTTTELKSDVAWKTELKQPQEGNNELGEM